MPMRRTTSAERAIRLSVILASKRVRVAWLVLSCDGGARWGTVLPLEPLLRTKAIAG